jgi:hypothetical protein
MVTARMTDHRFRYASRHITIAPTRSEAIQYVRDVATASAIVRSKFTGTHATIAVFQRRLVRNESRTNLGLATILFTICRLGAAIPRALTA